MTRRVLRANLLSDRLKNRFADICLVVALALAYFTWIHSPHTPPPDHTDKQFTHTTPYLRVDSYESYSQLQPELTATPSGQEPANSVSREPLATTRDVQQLPVEPAGQSQTRLIPLVRDTTSSVVSSVPLVDNVVHTLL